jgi:putative ABC transport system permease protein
MGIGIGVATLLAILGITQGLDTSFQKQLASMGSTSIYVSKWPWITMNWWEYRNRKNLTLANVDAVREQCTRCATVVPILDENDDVEFLDRKLTFVSVTGSTEEWLAVSTFEVAKGSFITAADNEGPAQDRRSRRRRRRHLIPPF